MGVANHVPNSVSRLGPTCCVFFRGSAGAQIGIPPSQSGKTTSENSPSMAVSWSCAHLYQFLAATTGQRLRAGVAGDPKLTRQPSGWGGGSRCPGAPGQAGPALLGAVRACLVGRKTGAENGRGWASGAEGHMPDPAPGGPDLGVSGPPAPGCSKKKTSVMLTRLKFWPGRFLILVDFRAIGIPKNGWVRTPERRER